MKKAQKRDIISASIMCIDFDVLIPEMKKIEKSIDYFHIDIMDGNFVPNITFGFYQINALRRYFQKPFDFHLMINNPENHLDSINIKKGDNVSFHIESTNSVDLIIEKVKLKGGTVSLAINPGTEISNIYEYLPALDGALVMTVNPGFKGQKLVESTLFKLKELQIVIVEKNYDIDLQVDGSVNFELAVKMKDFGANSFVVGSSSVFQGDNHLENLQKFKTLIDYR